MKYGLFHHPLVGWLPQAVDEVTWAIRGVDVQVRAETAMGTNKIWYRYILHTGRNNMNISLHRLREKRIKRKQKSYLIYMQIPIDKKVRR